MNRLYAGMDSPLSAAASQRAVIIPVPYDGTSTWGKGADRGPAALLDATDNMEVYDMETRTEVFREGVAIAEAIEGHGSPEAMCAAVKAATSNVLAQRQIPVIIGGEHSVSIGAIQACAEAYPELTVLHLDAHADLRDAYQGSPFNHACAVHWASRNVKLIQVGIRSMDESERPFIQPGNLFSGEHCHFTPDDRWMEDALIRCGREGIPLYITVDLDVFDPAFVPDTGTPEPGGLDWYQVTTLIRKASERFNIVGMDVVELAAHAGSKPSDFLAAKLLYKMLTYALKPAPIS